VRFYESSEEHRLKKNKRATSEFFFKCQDKRFRKKSEYFDEALKTVP
jgi:hypothetical protein